MFAQATCEDLLHNVWYVAVTLMSPIQTGTTEYGRRL